MTAKNCIYDQLSNMVDDLIIFNQEYLEGFRDCKYLQKHILVMSHEKK